MSEPTYHDHVAEKRRREAIEGTIRDQMKCAFDRALDTDVITRQSDHPPRWVEVEKNAVAIRFPAYREPTPQEEAEHDAWLAQAEREQQEATEQQVPAAAAYLGLDDPIAKHHAPDVTYGTVYCEGCDMGCSCERANWPCSTALLVARIHSIPLYDAPVTSWAHVVDRAQEDA